MRVHFHSAALAEMIEAANYYDEQQINLGREFENAIEAALTTISDSPKAWPRHFGDIRRYFLKRFPFAICYHVSGDDLTVIAVMHLRRHPDYWKDRV
jgi:plasmid stabilization system protein ParE